MRFQFRQLRVSLLLFFFSLIGFGADFALCALSLGLFHRLARLFGALGAEFGTLLALLVERLLAAQQFDERLLAAITLAEAASE